MCRRVAYEGTFVSVARAGTSSPVGALRIRGDPAAPEFDATDAPGRYSTQPAHRIRCDRAAYSRQLAQRVEAIGARIFLRGHLTTFARDLRRGAWWSAEPVGA